MVTFSSRDDALALAVGRAVMPEGSALPGFDEASLERLHTCLGYYGSTAVGSMVVGLLRTLDGLYRARYFGHRLEEAPAARIRDLLAGLERLSFPSRVAVRTALAPVKLAHFSGPEVHRALGEPYKRRLVEPEKPRWREQQVFDPEGLQGTTVLEADVVVVGTGAGGAVVAAELAGAGHQVVMVEEGAYYERADFARMSFAELSVRAYLSPLETAAIGNCVIPILAGRTVGGSTTVNSGTCYRTPDHVLESWSRDRGLEDLSPASMAPWLDLVEAELGVAPGRPEYLGGCARVIARGSEALGIRHGPLRRNAPECDGQGQCCLGCPTDAKRSANVSWVPTALKRGALCVTGARVDRILLSRGAAYGVSATARRANGTIVRFSVHASRVVIAAGTLQTPILLMRNGIATQSGHLGRHLTIHPAAACVARFDEVIEGARGIPQGYAIEEYHDEGILLEGAFPPPEHLAIQFSFLGPRLMETMAAFAHLAVFGFMIKDTQGGRVTLGPTQKPLILYQLGHQDTVRLKRGMQVLVDVYRAAGAREIYPPVFGHERLLTDRDLERFREARLGPRDFEMSAYHPLGTARMAARAADGVIDPDHQVYGVPGLHIVDGSSVPSALGVNPQITIMAMAARAARRISERLRERAAA
jgi:hypothetical protein